MAKQRLTSDELNPRERAVLSLLATVATSATLDDIARAFQKGGDGPRARNAEQAGWWARNSLRRPVREGFVRKTGRGTYRINPSGARVVAVSK